MTGRPHIYVSVLSTCGGTNPSSGRVCTGKSEFTGSIWTRTLLELTLYSAYRAFQVGVHNPLQMMILDRIKHQLGYPEADRDMLSHKTILTAVEQYTMGKARPLEEYKRIVGLNMTTKELTYTGWCEEGFPPPGFEQYNHLYPNGRKRMKETASK